MGSTTLVSPLTKSLFWLPRVQLTNPVRVRFGSNPTDTILAPALKCVTPQAHGDLDTIGVQLAIDQLVAAPSRTCQLLSAIES